MQWASLTSLLPVSFLSLPTPPAYSLAGFPSVPCGYLALEVALPARRGVMGLWPWTGSLVLVGLGEQGRGEDQREGIAFIPSTLCRRGLSKNIMRASPSSWAKVGPKNLQGGGKSGSLA